MKKPDRVLMLHGPVVRRLVITQAVTGMSAIAALILTLTLFSGRVDRASEQATANAAKLAAIQYSRQASAQDSCKLLRGLVLSAARVQEHAHIIPRHVIESRTREYLRTNHIQDCRVYAARVTAIPSEAP